MEIKYDVNNLFDMVQEYLQSEAECYHYVVNGVTSENEIVYSQYWGESRAYWIALSYACKMVNADIRAVIAVVKSINRYSKHTHWEKCITKLWYNDSKLARALFALD